MLPLCYCCSGKDYSQCCQPFLSGHQQADNAEALMRSRFSAYATKNYTYIYNTYAQHFRTGFTVDDIAKNDEGSHWLKLDVLNSKQSGSSATVEFKAFFSILNQFYLLHEISEFVLEESCWLYTKGLLIENSSPYIPKRNETCLCGSKLKFKKCCGR